MNKKSIVPALALVALLGLSACQAQTPEDQRTTSALPAPSNSAGQTLAPATGEHNASDVMFAQMMKIHHEQALTLSDLVLSKSDLDPQVKHLAEEIKAAQGPEIDQMRGWMAGWGVDSGSASDHMGHMDGMVAQSDLDKISAADSDLAQKLFLQHMIAHHEGAVAMAQDELKRGINPDAKALSQRIIEAQQKEIDEMNAILKRLG